MRHAVIGDIGGHVTALRHELVRLGVDVEAGTIPDDLTLVQVGDLVHRGPDSEAGVALVDRFLRHGDGRWVQLVGNHEAQYLRYPAFEWHDWIDEDAAGVLRHWWDSGQMHVAAVVPSPAGEVVVTHAGVTEEFWRRDLGRPQTATAAADRLNRMPGDGNNALFRGGVMLSGRLAMRAGPLWAEPARELLASWKGHRMPFNQVHGHASCFAWQARRWRLPGPIWRPAAIIRSSTSPSGAAVRSASRRPRPGARTGTGCSPSISSSTTC